MTDKLCRKCVFINYSSVFFTFEKLHRKNSSCTLQPGIGNVKLDYGIKNKLIENIL